MTTGEYPGGVPEEFLIPPAAFASAVEFPEWRDVAVPAGLALLSCAGGAVIDDLDGDHDLDVVVSDWNPRGQLRIYRNNGRGQFADATEESGVAGITGGLNLVHADYDNDGDADLLVLRGAWLGPHGRYPNSLLQNDGQGRFRHVTFADVDADGDLDLFVETGGANAGDAFRNVLFQNPGFGNHWLGVKLIGTRSNRFAIGARIRADFSENGRRRSVYRWVGSGGSFGGNPLRQHLGLGPATEVDVLEVVWPTTGRTQTFSQVPAGQIIQITEGESDYRTITPPPR